ncbi:MAG: hypothetical protein WC236_07215 [Gallionellaceae bacterium]|jgi:hypothetical protein
MALNLAPFGRWARQSYALASRLALRWATLMNVHIHLQIFILLTVGSILPIGSSLATELPINSNITSSNWERHPHIVEIRNIYNEIQSKLEKKQLKYQKKDYTVLPESCRGTYPLEYLSLATDSKEHVRVYIMAQRISHGDLMTTQSYYDSEGRLRFVYMTNESPGMATIENRVYINVSGKVFWDVTTEAKKITFGEVTQDPWMIRETNNHEILDFFNSSVVKCKK